MDFNKYLEIRLSRELILRKFPGNSFESLVELNQYLRICLSRELILSQFPVKPLSHKLNRFNFPRHCLSHELIGITFLERRLSRKRKEVKPSDIGSDKPKKYHTKSNLMGQRPNHNGIIES